MKNIVLKNFAKFTVKHLRRSLFFNKFTCPTPATLSKKETPIQVYTILRLNFTNSNKASENEISNRWFLNIRRPANKFIKPC